MKIGVGAPLTGLAAQLGREMMQTVQLAVEEANAGGGIQGLEVVAIDVRSWRLVSARLSMKSLHVSAPGLAAAVENGT